MGERRLEITYSRRRLRKFSKLINSLGTGGISGDETDTGRAARRSGQPRYKIAKLPWRSAKLTRLLRLLDLLNLHQRFTSTGRASAGNWPRYRVDSELQDDTPPVPGLPENCYDERWLAHQDETTIEELDMQDEMSLDIHPDLLEWVLLSTHSFTVGIDQFLREIETPCATCM